MSANLLAPLLKDLLLDTSRYCVELYDGSGISWQCIKRGSPGNWKDFDAELARVGDILETQVIVAITLTTMEGTMRTVGLAYADLSSRVIGACEFADDEHFCQLETALIQLGAKECVIPSSSSNRNEKATGKSVDVLRLHDVIGRCNALLSERPKATFATKSLDQDLERLLKGNNAVEQHRSLLERTQAASAIAGLLAFTEVMADSQSHNKFSLTYFDTGRAMRLDSAAQRALNIVRGRDDANDSFSLYGLMNRGKTAMGKRLLKVWLKQPLVDLESINQRHDVISALLSDGSLRADLQQLHLRGLPDIERLTRKLEKEKTTLSDLCQLYRASSRLTLIEEALRKYQGPGLEYLLSRYADPLREAHDADHLIKFEELLEAAIDLDRIPEEYLIAPTYDAGLEEIQVEKEEVEREILQLANAAADDLGLVLEKTVKLEWHKSSNQRLRCLRITAKEEKAVRKKLQAKYMELETRKDGMKFTNKPLKAAAERLQRLASDYDTRQSALVAQVVNVASTFSEIWESVSSLVAELDVLVGFADLAASAPRPYCRPTMLDAESGGIIRLEGCRHPCVEVQDGVDFIPNDCIMDKDSNTWFQVITGPNMGGKSTFIRQVGVCVLMAQVGSFVPCDSATIAVRDAIFARVGAGDCQLRGVSTFMAEMLETAAIIKGASKKSLVIIDELGRGTSTWDGLGLAWAISEHLMSEIGCATLFATHFYELTGLPGIKNLHVKTAVDETNGALTMLYQVHQGSCDQSFGIHVAEFAKFPAEVVEAARKRAEELESSSIDGGGSIVGKRKRGDALNVAMREALIEFASLPLGGDEVEVKEKLTAWFEKASTLLPADQDPKKQSV